MATYQSQYTGAQIDAAIAQISNIGEVVRFDIAQTKTDAEKAQARSNCGAASADSMKIKGYTAKTAVSTINNYRACYVSNSQRAYLASNSGQVVKAYPVKAGEKLVIRTFGYDVESFDCAVIGEELVGGGESTPIVQIIECGGSTYPADYTNHVLFVTVEGNGYLYINEKTSTSVSAFAADEVEGCYDPNGIIKDTNDYYHFIYNGEGKFVVRKFNRRGPNNLLQMTSAGIGLIINGIGYVEITPLTGAIDTDIIGPFSMKKAGTSGGGVWAGGNHSVTVGSVACPTAEQISLSVTMNGNTISDNGIYYGNARITAKNKIYYAQSIQGNTFEGAEAAIIETRTYDLSDSMKVSVSVELLENTYFAAYYGMQYVNRNISKVIMPADEAVISLPLSTSYVSTHKQSDIILEHESGSQLHMEMDSVGLGTYSRNDGSYADYGFAVIGSYGKTYYTLIANVSIDSGAVLYWSGNYRYVI